MNFLGFFFYNIEKKQSGSWCFLDKLYIQLYLLKIDWYWKRIYSVKVVVFAIAYIYRVCVIYEQMFLFFVMFKQINITVFGKLSFNYWLHHPTVISNSENIKNKYFFTKNNFSKIKIKKTILLSIKFPSNRQRALLEKTNDQGDLLLYGSLPVSLRLYLPALLKEASK